ncbi:MAG: 4Fe-4S binding protein [Desulfomonile tiedjei]|nr:4Fe-4S binding protein [Desulfomonile tiedjei]
MSDVYRRLAEKLNQLPNGFPPTESGVELKILQKIFAPDEAEMAMRIRPIPETVEAIAQRLAKSLDEMQAILDNMVEKGQIGTAKVGDQQVYLLFPFVLGIYEFQLNRLDRELAELFEEYAPTLLKVLGNFKPGFFRVIPVNQQIKAQHEVKPYEDVRRMVERSRSFQVSDCICRKEQALVGNPCSHPLETCLSFSRTEGAFDKHRSGRIISKEEALEVIAKAEEDRLVHQTYNVQSGHMFVCNCCSCCCGVLRGLKQYAAPYMVAGSNFVASIDRETCEACGLCANERCPVGAIAEENDVYTVQPERCIGCGVCTTACPTESIQLIRKPESQRDEPPNNLFEWYFKRAADRGIKIMID